MFNGLDYQSKGYLDLTELKEVINYVQATTQEKTFRRHVDPNNILSGSNLKDVFQAMGILTDILY